MACVGSVIDDMRHNLLALGWNQSFEDAAQVIDSSCVIGRVSRLDRGWSTIKMSASSQDDGNIRVRNIGADVAVGDWVAVDKDLERVEEVLPRYSALIRRASSDAVRAEHHAVAANIDTVFIVHAATNESNQRRVERELVLAFDSRATPVLVLTKNDLSDAPEHIAALRDVARVCGISCHIVSGLTGEGLDELARYGENHRSVAVLGASGVGKSTLVNRLVGGTSQPVGEVRQGDQRGRHTTVAADLVALPNGGWLIDTPGLRALNLWTSGHGIERAFADIFSLAEDCKFRDCKHQDEPSCAVRVAIERQEISIERLESMGRLVAEELALEDEQKVRVRMSNRKGSRKLN
ncbi:MAG: ribosome small subunit-dependent GTPase A [Acidimicrobiaceae bacterium]|nr:ribosome small subunit-dependent GTPase A [Acidimicrobiaceae bacterium]